MSFYLPSKLPRLMVAPNGVRPMKKDHPKVPITIDEIVETAKLSYQAGAEAIHFHIRDENGLHVLDSKKCSEAIIKLNLKVPKMHLQVTTEAIKKYSPKEMREYAYNVSPPGISIAVRELLPTRTVTDEDLIYTANIYGPLVFDSGPGTPVEAVVSWMDYKTMAEEGGIKLVPNSNSNDKTLLAWAPIEAN